MMRALLYISLILFVFASLVPLQGKKPDPPQSEKRKNLQQERKKQEEKRVSSPPYIFEGANPPKEMEMPAASWWQQWQLPLSFSLVLIIGLAWVLYRYKKRQSLPPPNDTISINQPAESGDSQDPQQAAESLLQRLLSVFMQDPALRNDVQVQLTNDEKGRNINVIAPEGYKGNTISQALSKELAHFPGGTISVSGEPDSTLVFSLLLPSEVRKGINESNVVEEVHSDNPQESLLELRADNMPVTAQIDEMDRTRLSSQEEAFLNRIKSVVTYNLGDSEFNAEAFREEIGMSKTQFYRKVQALTDQSPGQFIRNMRLQRARNLLENGSGNVSEVAFEVGFNNLSYFSKCFRKQYGQLPSEYPPVKT